MRHTITETALMIERCYEAFQMQMVGCLMHVLEEPAPTSPGARARLGATLQDAQVQILTTIGSTVSLAAEGLVNEAIQSFNPDLSVPNRKTVTKGIEQARIEFMQQVARAASADAMVVTRSMRDFAHQADQAMSVRGASYTGAVVTARMGMDTDFKMFQTDSAGRKWPSALYVKTSARSFLVSTRAETSVYALAQAGVDTAVVRYPNPEHPNHGLQFSITGATPDLPAYPDIRELWHPNSDAYVSKE